MEKANLAFSVFVTCMPALYGGVPMGANDHRHLLHLFRHSIEN